MSADLPSLIARVEAAYRDDAKLVREAATTLIRPLPGVEYHDEWWARFDLKLGAFAYLDAVIALCERVKPGWDWSVHSHKQGDAPSYRDAWGGMRAPPKGIVSGILYESNGYTPTLALLLALLRAVQATKQETT